MHRQRGVLVVFALVVLAAVVATATAVAAIKPFATGKNKTGQLIAAASGNATLAKPVYVTITDVPSQLVTVQWNLNCPTAAQGSAKTSQGKFKVKAPVVNKLVAKLPGKPPCITVVYVSEPKKGKLTIALSQH